MVHRTSFKLVGGENRSSSILPAERKVASSIPSRKGEGEEIKLLIKKSTKTFEFDIF